MTAMHIPPNIQRLPIASVLPALSDTLANSSNAVLQAQPGAGKTTGVPLAVIDEPWLQHKRIIMLEPRRLAARAAACRMAEILGEPPGQTVGYRMRMDTLETPDTRILVVTEGILTRMLRADPALEGVGMVIFDEFHERSLNADIGLALTLDMQDVLRPDMRILVMSATLAIQNVSSLLGNAPVLQTKGRSFSVETRYSSRTIKRRGLADAVVKNIMTALHEESGSLLVFLPGAREIHRVHHKLKDAGVGQVDHLRITALHGSMPRKTQRDAIQPAGPGTRKIVLATDIAETSLTIEGVSVVVDSGHRRRPKFDPRTGLTRLETARISRASAEQRQGRAGRTEPGVCYRLWTAAEHAAMPEYDEPEILNADLAAVVLNLADWGVRDPATLRWLDPPPTAAWVQGRELLSSLDALHDDGRITQHGRRLQDVGTHPRLAHMLWQSQKKGIGVTACMLAALLEERDILHSLDGPADPDIALRLEALSEKPERNSIAGMTIDRSACRPVKKVAQRWIRHFNLPKQRSDATDAGLALAFAYPDRIAKLRKGSNENYLLRNGRGATLPDATTLTGTEYLVIADLDDSGRNASIRLAAAIQEDEILSCHGREVCQVKRVEWNHDEERVLMREEWRLGSLLIRGAPFTQAPAELVRKALLKGIREKGLECLPWSAEARDWQARVLFLRKTLGEQWPDVSDAALSRNLELWLAPFITGMKCLSDLKQLDILQALKCLLSWELQQKLDNMAPTHIRVPSGSRIRLDYMSGDVPVLAVRLQEMFGASRTPSVAGGGVTVIVKLLSPAQRPVQVTQDLANFWNETYEQVRKDLRGRYPKHYWPENPWKAEPTPHVKPRKK